MKIGNIVKIGINSNGTLNITVQSETEDLGEIVDYAYALVSELGFCNGVEEDKKEKKVDNSYS
jgi:hypothetical protein